MLNHNTMKAIHRSKWPTNYSMWIISPTYVMLASEMWEVVKCDSALAASCLHHVKRAWKESEKTQLFLVHSFLHLIHLALTSFPWKLFLPCHCVGAVLGFHGVKVAHSSMKLYLTLSWAVGGQTFILQSFEEKKDRDKKGALMTTMLRPCNNTNLYQMPEIESLEPVALRQPLTVSLRCHLRMKSDRSRALSAPHFLTRALGGRWAR